MNSRTIRLARQITELESGRVPRIPDAGPSSSGLLAKVIGVSGPPGVGKSVLLGQLARHLVALGSSVAILAVDPSSQFSGGAILADRVRMPLDLDADQLFIRSLSSRGALGGLSVIVPAAISLLQAASFDFILVETVGVGQNETEILNVAETIIVVQAPDSGDEAQALKAGILEIADVVVVNKMDLDGSQLTVRMLRNGINAITHDGWRRQIVSTSALTGEGIPELVKTILQHREWMAQSDRLDFVNRRRLESYLKAYALQTIERRLPISAVAADLSAGRLTFDEAIRRLIERLSQ